MFRLPILTILVTFSLLIPAIVGAQPFIHGELSGELGPGTYLVDGECQVLYDDSLRILPGTTFLHTGYFTWQIQGQLLAEGTEDAPIRFQRLDPIEEHRWGGFQFFLGLIG